MPIYITGDIYYRHGCENCYLQTVAEMRQFFVVATIRTMPMEP